jgi:hypothetical protein
MRLIVVTFIFESLACLAAVTGQLRQPTSQPTVVFVAPSVPQEFLKDTPTLKPVAKVTPRPTGSIGDAANKAKPNSNQGPNSETVAGAINVNAELKSETNTALNSATYIFYTLITCIVYVID